MSSCCKAFIEYCDAVGFLDTCECHLPVYLESRKSNEGLKVLSFMRMLDHMLF